MRVILLLSILTFAKGAKKCGLPDKISNVQYEVRDCKDCSSNLCQEMDLSTASSKKNVCYWNAFLDMCASSDG